MLYHHGHFVQTWLPIEQHIVPIDQMALHFVAHLQMPVRVLLQKPQVQALPVLPHNVLGACLAWRWVRPILNQLLQPTTGI